jgi:hypothetical protein
MKRRWRAAAKSAAMTALLGAGAQRVLPAHFSENLTARQNHISYAFLENSSLKNILQHGSL